MSKLPKRKVVTRYLSDISPYEMETTLEKLAEQVQQWIDQYGLSARLSWDANFHHPYDTSPSPRFDVLNDELETDAEYLARCTQEEKLKKDKEDKDRADYERLRKQFEGK